MPLVTICSLAPSDPEAIRRMVIDVRDAGSEALKCSPDNIWVMFHTVPPGYYVQGLAPATEPQAESHPPTVIVRAQVGRTHAERTDLVAAVATAVGKGLSIPAENVWVHYQEMRSEDVWFKGHWSA